MIILIVGEGEDEALLFKLREELIKLSALDGIDVFGCHDNGLVRQLSIQQLEEERLAHEFIHGTGVGTSIGLLLEPPEFQGLIIQHACPKTEEESYSQPREGWFANNKIPKSIRPNNNWSRNMKQRRRCHPLPGAR